MSEFSMALGIDPGADHNACVLLNRKYEILHHGEIEIPGAFNNVGQRSWFYSFDECIYVNNAVIVLECPWLVKGKGRAQRYSGGGQTPLMGTIRAAERLRIRFTDAGFKVYLVEPTILRQQITGWNTHRGKYDPYCNQWIKSQGYSTGRNTPLNSTHARDAFIAAQWGVTVALGKPTLAYQYLDRTNQ